MTAVLCVALLPLGALAQQSTVVEIDSDADLVDAILKQADEQTWIFTKAGTYDAKNTNGNGYYPYQVYDPVQEFVFPIHADNLTIKKADGVGEVIVTSSVEPDSGAWHYQNFITVFGQGVTIDGVTLKSNKSGYPDYEGTCNKALELYAPGKSLSLKNIKIQPLDDGKGRSFGGSIYLNVTDAGTTVIENVTMDAWINARAVTTGKVTVTNLTQDFTNSQYAGYHDNGKYGWNPGVSGDCEGISVTNHTIIVDEKTNLNEQVFQAEMRDGTTVKLSSNVQIDKMLNITKNNITLDLNNYTITASDSFTYTDTKNKNDAHLVNVQGAGVTLKNGTLKTTDENKHALNLYSAENVTLENLTLDHTNASTGAPMVINGSDVLVQGKLTLITGENSWYAANVDSKSTGTAYLEFGQNSTVAFQGKSRSNMGIVMDNSVTGGQVSVVFDPHVDIQSPEDFIALYNNAGDGGTIVHPENGDLVQHGDEWVAEHDPDPTPTPKPTAQPTATPTAAPQKPPKTGDDSQLGLWMALLVLSVGCGCALLIRNRRRMNHR